ncbi:hypothetical protein [Actinoplanes sp. NPDC020271]|uniref:hypothetical protein n=1 Tax=Actinoplanes sp. NPDC020271 TaxID=3363896 RepID=UPI0037AF030C
MERRHAGSRRRSGSIRSGWIRSGWIRSGWIRSGWIPPDIRLAGLVVGVEAGGRAQPGVLSRLVLRSVSGWLKHPAGPAGEVRRGWG